MGGITGWLAGRIPEQAWTECDRADWLLWWASLAGADKKLVVTVTCQLARYALPLARSGDERPALAVEAAQRWCDGPGTRQEAHSAAVDAATDAGDADAEGAAAYAAASAAFAAEASATPNLAAYSADAASYAASAYAISEASKDLRRYSQIRITARAAKLREFAGIVRKYIPFPGPMPGVKPSTY